MARTIGKRDYLIEACASYGGFLWSQGFSFDEAGYEKFRSLEARKILAEAGRDAMNKDIEAVEQFEKILNCERWTKYCIAGTAIRYA